MTKKKNAIVYRDVHPSDPHREISTPVDEVKKHWLVETLIDWTIALIFVGLMFWLHSLNSWWTDALAKYGFYFLFTAGFVGTYAPWAFDDVLDLEEERRLEFACLLMVFGIPLVFVLGQQALCQPFELGAGPWPIWADLSARVIISGGALLGSAFTLAKITRRSKPTRPQRFYFYLSSIMFFSACFCLVIWPWLNGDIPIWQRLTTITVFLTIFTLASRSAQWVEPAPSEIAE
jgi:hypothetical protein